MLILNASNEPVSARFDGALYYFRPDERKDIFNGFAANHILSRWGKFGLVDITWNEKLAKEFVDHELYVHSQRIFGLTQFLQTLMEKVQNFLSYDEECGDKKTVERLRFAQQRKLVEDKVVVLEKLLKALEGFDTQKLLDQKARELTEQAAVLKAQAVKLQRDNHTGKPQNQHAN